MSSTPPPTAPDLAAHPGFRRMYAPDRLTVGMFLPFRSYAGDLGVMAGHGALVERLDRSAFAGLWVRDIPLFDPGFGDIGQVFDPWTSLAWLAGRTENLALAAGSAVFSLRHPIDLAKQATSIDRLSGGRLVLGAASGDRATEYPAYGIDYAGRGERFREAVEWFRALSESEFPELDGGPGTLRRLDLLPKPAAGRVPLIVTGSSQQTPEWIARHADGWLLYPGPTASPVGPIALGRKIAAWRELIPEGAFKPVTTNEWIELDEDPDARPTALRGGFVLRTGTNGLLDLLERWRAQGVNHAALGIQHGRRPAEEAVQQLIEEVAPHFPAITAVPPLPSAW